MSKNRIEIRSPHHERVRFEIRWWDKGKHRTDYDPDQALVTIFTDNPAELLDDMIAALVIDPTEADCTTVWEA